MDESERSKRSAFARPPRATNARGEIRGVGVELEFSGITLRDAAEAVRRVVGGEVVEDGPFELRVATGGTGDYRVEVDATLLRDRRYMRALEEIGVPVDHLADLEEPIEEIVGWIAERFVPLEVITPPLPLDQLDSVESLRRALAARGARGTGSRWRYAFGLHLNPEVPSLGVASLLAHLRAFLVLYDWLVEASRIDLTRSLTSFIDPFDVAYRRLVLSPSYEPTLEEMAADYVAHNPTRNRPLDLLPLFVHALGPEVATAIPEHEPLSARPTYHYRLPNCRLDEPDWTVAEEWNRWVEVERLADRSEELLRGCAKARPEAEDEDPSLWTTIRGHTLRALRGDAERETK